MNICVMAGDGIGPEIVEQAVRVLRAPALGLNLSFTPALVGGAAYRAAGHPLPDETLALARTSDAILFGAVGDFSLDTLPRELRPEQAILGLRKELNLFANFRPAMVYPELANASSLKPEIVAGLDILIIRELTGDIYFGQPRGIGGVAVVISDVIEVHPATPRGGGIRRHGKRLERNLCAHFLGNCQRPAQHR